jgi:hypothetical protein
MMAPTRVGLLITAAVRAICPLRAAVPTSL